MSRKEISSETVVKAIVTGFVSYGIIIFVLCALIAAVGDQFLKNIPTKESYNLYITVPLIASIFIYFIIHLVCRLSTYDVFKKCKTDAENYSTIVKYLSLFFIALIFLTIVVFLSLLYLNLKYQIQSIALAELQYESIFSNEHTGQLMKEMEESFNQNKVNSINSTIILVLGVTLSTLTLIPYQSKMLKRYNEQEEKEPEKQENTSDAKKVKKADTKKKNK